MSPKKKRKNTGHTAARAPARAAAPALGDEHGARPHHHPAADDTATADPAAVDTAQEDAPAKPRISRTPVVLDDRRRWPVAVWSGLASAWFLGSLVFFVLFLAEGFALMGTGGGQSGAAGLDTAAWYLLGLVVCALLLPLVGIVWAALLRRKIAAVLFSVALVLSGALLFSLDSPASIAAAIANGVTSN